MTAGSPLQAPPSWWLAEPASRPAPPAHIRQPEPEPEPRQEPAPEDHEERDALIEVGAEVPRTWAEDYASLCMMPPPDGFLPDRWRGVVDAVGLFLDRWAAEAVRFGWSDLDVFGCHDIAPTTRRDAMGLIMLLTRCEVAAIDPDGADLVTVSGAHQRFRRRPLPPGTVSLWELAHDATAIARAN